MIKTLAILAAVVCLGQTQRPPYAGSSNRYPVVLPQFREEQEAAGVNIGNRIDVESSNSLSASAATSTIPPDLPVDANGDIDLINRIRTWPMEKWPFWYLNWRQIQEHRGDANNRAQAVQPEPNNRSFFLG